MSSAEREAYDQATEDRARELRAEREPDPLDILAEQELNSVRMTAALKVVQGSLF